MLGADRRYSASAMDRLVLRHRVGLVASICACCWLVGIETVGEVWKSGLPTVERAIPLELVSARKLFRPAFLPPG